MIPPFAILLGAGEGQRMGGPKALLMVDGKPLLSSHVERFREAGCRPILVVVRATIAHQVQALLAEQPEAQLCVVDTDSMAASLAMALRRTPYQPSRRVVVSPVDTLPVRLSTLHALLAAVLAPDVHVATPSYHARAGHPVVARESLLQPFRDGYHGSLRDLLRSAEPQRRRVDLDDPDVVSDFDRPEDLAAHRPGLVPQFAGPQAVLHGIARRPDD